MREKQRPKVVVDYTQYRNAARAAPMSGRFMPRRYSSNQDTKHMLSTAQFYEKHIHNQPGNPYTDSGDMVEVGAQGAAPAPVSPQSPQTPVTAISETSQRSETQSSLGGSTIREDHDDHTSSLWYILFPSYKHKILLGLPLTRSLASLDSDTNGRVRRY
jgi:hypothetical protein